VKWGGSQVIALGGAILSDFIAAGESVAWSRWGPLIAGFIWFAWFVQLVITYSILRIDYEQRWYVLTDRSLRVREGVLRLNEKTMTFANIQHLTVRQGPIQRLLGIADVEVRTAGGGGATPGAQPGGGRATASTHTAYFRGVDNAEEIRNVIRDRIRHHRDTGLGDPDDEAHAEAPGAVPGAIPGAIFDAAPGIHPAGAVLLEAARSLSAEARALRKAVAGEAG
jgi:uncharacterized membrane protein YdbT with pleckstrin-like domain